MNVEIDERFLLQTLTDLVRINSVNPTLVPGAPAELEIGAYIADALGRMLVDTTTYQLGPNRVNVVGVIRGAGGGRSLMINGHMDTVGVDGMSAPFSGEVRDGRLYGRGSQDMKGGLAAMLAAFRALMESGFRLKGDLIYAAVADEEYGSIGTEALVKLHKPNAAIVAEPTELDVCIAHKGFCVFEIETRGKAAHGARYMDGIDANLHMGRVLVELDRRAAELLGGRTHALLGPPSLLVPLIKGGTHQFVYPDQCTISVERRTLPGERKEQIERELEGMLIGLRSDDEKFRATVRTVMVRNPYEISKDAEIVKVVTDSVGEVLGRPPTYIGHHWWEDAALIAQSGTETVIIGTKGGGIHSHEEWVDVRSVVDLARILAHSAISYCS